MTTKQITAVNTNEKIKRLYETAFPEDEQIPWKDLMRLVEEMPLDFTAYYDGDLSTGSGTLPCAKSYGAKAMVRRY